MLGDTNSIARTVNCFVIFEPLPSVAVILTVVLTTAVGVPLIVPATPFSVSPAGRLPPVIAYVIGLCPPVIASTSLYSTPTHAVGSAASVPKHSLCCCALLHASAYALAFASACVVESGIAL